MEYRLIETSAEVAAVIHARHQDLAVHSSFSDPGGEHTPGRGVMVTAWGFKDSPIPIFRVRSEWDIDPEKPAERNNHERTYWLCFPEECED